eukprot:13789061-Alexandrium_andersonii.AAC.1
MACAILLRVGSEGSASRSARSCVSCPGCHGSCRPSPRVHHPADGGGPARARCGAPLCAAGH